MVMGEHPLLITHYSSLFTHPPFHLQHPLGHGEDAVGVERYGFDAVVYQPLGEFGVVGGRLAADPHVLAGLAAGVLEVEEELVNALRNAGIDEGYVEVVRTWIPNVISIVQSKVKLSAIDVTIRAVRILLVYY